MKKAIGTALIIVFIAGAVFSGFMFAKQYGDAKESEDAFSKLQELVKDTTATENPSTGNTPPEETGGSATEETTQPDEVVTAYEKYLPLYELNNDFVGWISIEGTGIDYPVMHTPENHDYYLKHSFEKKWSDYGVPYVDGSCVMGQSNNLVIYGHHMRNGSMFYDLEKYADFRFWQEHPVIQFDTLEEFGTYEVIAAFRYNTYHEDFYYHKLTDMDESVFTSYVEKCMERRLYDTGKTAVYGDRLITLSTCEYTYENGRFVVVARKIVE